jgi:hypothetical protein
VSTETVYLVGGSASAMSMKPSSVLILVPCINLSLYNPREIRQ